MTDGTALDAARVLVTGASGFVGRHCVTALERANVPVHAVSGSGRTFSSAASTQWHHCDLHDAAERAALLERTRPTHLLHAAWYAEPRLYWHSSENARWVETTAALVREFAAYGRRMVGVGTAAEYGDRGGVLVEEFSATPTTPYGACKYASYVVARSIARELKLSMAWGRLFGVYGAGEPPSKLVSAIAARLIAGQPFTHPETPRQRDYLFVEDAAEAFVALLLSDVEEVVNIGSGSGLTVAEIAAAVAAETGRPELISTTASDPWSADPQITIADTRRLLALGTWKPRHDLATGVRSVVAHLRNFRHD
jgi:nucleoside-diphosphate-sugar epimerase